MSWKLVGHIGVDAGLCWIGDPCYVLHSESLPNTLGGNWSEFCDSLGEAYPTAKSYNYDMGHEGLGCVVSTGCGDGVYPVVANIDDVDGWGSRVKEVRVLFFHEDYLNDDGDLEIDGEVVKPVN